MNTLTKMALGLIGQLKPTPLALDAGMSILATHRESFASVAAGAMAQNVYLYCASTGLATVMRAWFDRTALGQSMGLDADQQILLTQTVGMPNASVGT